MQTLVMTVAEAFNKLQESFNPAAAGGLDKLIQISVTGDEAGTYNLHIVNQTCQLLTDPGDRKPDLQLTASAEIWQAVSEGKQDAMGAVLSGKLKWSGDIGLAMKIPSLFRLK